MAPSAPVVVKLRPAYADADLAFKHAYVRHLLAAGTSVQLVMVLRGAEIADLAQARAALDALVQAMADLAALTGEVVLEGRRLTGLLVPRPAAIAG